MCDIIHAVVARHEDEGILDALMANFEEGRVVYGSSGEAVGRIRRAWREGKTIMAEIEVTDEAEVRKSLEKTMSDEEKSEGPKSEGPKGGTGLNEKIVEDLAKAPAPAEPNGQPLVGQGPQPAIIITYDRSSGQFGWGFVMEGVPHAGVVNVCEMLKAAMISQQTALMQRAMMAEAQRGIVGPDGAPVRRNRRPR